MEKEVDTDHIFDVIISDEISGIVTTGKDALQQVAFQIPGNSPPAAFSAKTGMTMKQMVEHPPMMARAEMPVIA